MSTAPQQSASVLIVDDSAVARQAVSRAITMADGMRVAGLAQDGRVGLKQVDDLMPDAVVLDLEMPAMDGIAFLRHLRKTHPDLPVVVFSTESSHGAVATLEAISAGATAYVLKPSTLRGSGDGDAHTDLIPVLRAVLNRPAPRPSAPQIRRPPIPGHIQAVVVAVSTGGPSALNAVLPDLPTTLGVPVLVVQHMPATFTPLLAQRLNARCHMPVAEAVDGQPIVADRIYIAPGGRHLTVAGTAGAPTVRLTDEPAVNSCRPAADLLFESAAKVFTGPVLAVVMTGMGADGLRGSQAVVDRGGALIAQDPATAVVGSMPAAVIDAGLPYKVVTLDAIAAEIVHLAQGARVL